MLGGAPPARVTKGMDWPDAAGECCTPGQVLFISGEDEADDTLVPRLIEMGADLDKVIFLILIVYFGTQVFCHF